MKLVIIIPTYNERDNIVPLVDLIQVQFDLLASRLPGLVAEILVVDDHSPDGTAEQVRVLQARYPGMHLLEGEKCGLGAAYIRGMTYAMDTLGADVVFEMDADLSHLPEDIPRLLDGIMAGADFVIGSRYVPGGSIPANWGWHRRLISWGGNMVIRHFAGVGGVHDCTAGFRAIRTSLLRRIDLGGLAVEGYVFQVALLHAAQRAGARVVEMPVDFIDRTRGASKLRLADILEFARHSMLMRLRKAESLIKFSLVGISGVVVNLAAFTIFLDLGWNKYMASPAAVELAIISNFLLNNLWTFRERKHSDPVHLRGLKFNLVSLASLSISTLGFVAMSRTFHHLPAQVCQLAGMLPAWMVNFLVNANWTFKEDDASSAPPEFHPVVQMVAVSLALKAYQGGAEEEDLFSQRHGTPTLVPAGVAQEGGDREHRPGT